LAAGAPLGAITSRLSRVGLCVEVPGGGVCDVKCMGTGDVVLPIALDIPSPELCRYLASNNILLQQQ
jgi:hypothetical protein